jgi:hypothetical protein
MDKIGNQEIRAISDHVLHLAGERPMAILVRATRLFAAVAAFGAAGLFAASAQGPNPATTTVSAPSLTRPEFTRPAGIPGSARAIAANEQYLLAPAQPSDPVAPKKRKRR